MRVCRILYCILYGCISFLVWVTKKKIFLVVYVSFFLAYNISLHSIGWLLVSLVASNRLLHWLIWCCILSELCTLFIFSSFIFLVHFFIFCFWIVYLVKFYHAYEGIPYNKPFKTVLFAWYIHRWHDWPTFSRNSSHTLSIFRCCQ